MHYLLPDFCETSVLCQIRNVAMHLTIHLDMLNHLETVSFQSAIEIVQIGDATHLACRRVEQLCGNRFRDGVISFLLVAAHQIIALLLYHSIQFGDFIGTVLQIGIHCDHNIALGSAETAEECWAFAVIPTKFNAMHSGITLRKLFDDSP